MNRIEGVPDKVLIETTVQYNDEYVLYMNIKKCKTNSCIVHTNVTKVL